MFDVIVRHGTVIDGSKARRFSADVGIVGDRIDAVGDLSAAPASLEIDASGKIVAPGFIDLHNHSDGWMLKTPHLAAKTTQGFTTEVLMADGISYAPVRPDNVADWVFYLRSLNALRMDEYRGWQSLEDFLREFDRRNVQNGAVHVPYANVRVNACGWGRAPADDFQMREIQDSIRRGMDAGAVGLSTGLDYISECFAGTDELAAACSAISEQRGLYVTHVRYKLGTLAGIREAVEIGRRARVPVHVSHLKAPDTAAAEQILEYIDRKARQEVDFSFDVYPYQPGSTMLSFLLPYEVWEQGPLAALRKLTDPAVQRRFASGLDNYDLDLDRIHIAWTQGKENGRHQGKRLSEYVAETGRPAAEALCNLLIEERLAVLLVFNQGDDALVHPFLGHDLYLMGSDGIFFEDGVVHPRVYGSATRLLGPCVRDWKLFSLEDAVFKLSGGPARRFGLADRGSIRPGGFADVVVFDADTVCDRATYDRPHQFSAGIEHVLVNGVPVIRDGEPLQQFGNTWPGRALRSQR